MRKAAIFDDQGRVLLLRRSATDDRRPGEQDFPGGNVEPGEELIAGVAREIFEEAGLTIDSKLLKLFYAATEMFGDRSLTRLVFWAKVDAPIVQLSHEHDQYHWVQADRVYDEFPHPVYGSALVYGLEHGLFTRQT